MAITVTHTTSLHDALPISRQAQCERGGDPRKGPAICRWRRKQRIHDSQCRSAPSKTQRSSHCDTLKHRRDCLRSEEHTSELQSHVNLVCRLLLEKKNDGYI